MQCATRNFADDKINLIGRDALAPEPAVDCLLQRILIGHAVVVKDAHPAKRRSAIGPSLPDRFVDDGHRILDNVRICIGIHNLPICDGDGHENGFLIGAGRCL